MTLQLDPPAPLELPGEDPAAVEELAAAVTSGAFHVGLLGVHLAGPAASVRDWVGEDAAAAAAQVGVLGQLVHGVREAVSTAAARLSAHADAVRGAIARVRALRAVQREEFAAAVHRLAVLVGGPVDGARVELPAAVAVVEEWRAAEAGRTRAHAALLAGLADDAAATGRVLAGCTAVVGGAGVPGDDVRVLRHLALALPGWGGPELAARGAALGRLLTDRVVDGGRLALPDGAAELAGTPAYADGVVGALGVAGLERLLAALGAGGVPRGSPLAGVLAAVVSAAARSDGTGGAVLRARLVDPRGSGTVDDLVAIGMGELLSVAGTERDGGPPAALVADWGAQVLAREAAQLVPFATGASAVARTRSPWPGGTPDPVEAVLRLLLADGDAGAAARLLATPAAWAGLLDHVSLDQPDLTRVVALAVGAGGDAGAAALRAGLARLGAGLADGEAGDWTVDRQEFGWVAPAVADAVRARPGVAVAVLRAAGARSAMDAEADAALRGLGYLTLVPEVAGRIEDALRDRVGAQLPGAADDAVRSAAAVVGAYTAVREYGQRLAYALHGFEQRAEALDRARTTRAVDVLSGFLGKPGAVIAMALPYVAHWAGADGTWDDGRDAGRVFHPGDAALAGLLQVRPGGGGPTGASAEQAIEEGAAAAFVATGRRLGVPLPPASPSWSLARTLIDTVVDAPDKENPFAPGEPGEGHPRGSLPPPRR